MDGSGMVNTKVLKLQRGSGTLMAELYIDVRRVSILQNGHLNQQRMIAAMFVIAR